MYEGDSYDTEAEFRLSLEAPPQSPVTYYYETVDGKATVEDGDYRYASGQVTFPSGVQEATVSVWIIANRSRERDEEFALHVYPEGGDPAEATTAECMIIDDDKWPLWKMVGFWKFEEEYGTSTTDYSGYGNHAILTDDGNWGDGVDGSATLFSQDADYVTINTDNWSTTQGTISLWANASQFSDRPQYIFGHASVPWSNRIQLYTESSDGNLNLGLGDNHRLGTNLIQLTPREWHHIALTWREGFFSLYVDARLIAQGTYFGLEELSPTADLGNTGYPTERDQSFQGRIDEVLIYAIDLTAEDIDVLYQATTGELFNAAEPAWQLYR